MNDNNGQFIPLSDIYDTSNWDNLDNNLRYILIEKCPIKESNFVYPKYNLSRHFYNASYTRKLSNSGTRDRKWLIYSNMKVKHKGIQKRYLKFIQK